MPCRPAPDRAGCGATTTDAGHPDTGQNRRELRAVTPLPGGDHDRQRLLTLLTGQMHLGVLREVAKLAQELALQRDPLSALSEFSELK